MTSRTVHVPLGDAAYDVNIGEGLLTDIGPAIATSCPAARYAIIADSTVAELFGEPVRLAIAEHAPCELFT